jgi:LmbE family N-acetylglucosaminyl deacetylase
MKKFLVISPHPDDSDFGCAGTVINLVQAGSEVEYLIVSDGSKGSHVVGFGGEKLAAMREQEQRAAAGIAGVQTVRFLREVDGEMENTQSLRKKLVAAIRQVKPDIVLSFDPSSLLFESVYRSHRDHRVIAEAVFDAVYPGVGNSSFFPELAEEGYAPHQVEELWFFATPRPNKWVDVSGVFETKLQALFAHTSQFEDKNDVEERLRNKANAEGKEKNMKYAECFRVVDFIHEHAPNTMKSGK